MKRLLALLLAIGCSILPLLAASERAPDRIPGHVLVRSTHHEVMAADKSAKHLRKLGNDGWELWNVGDVDAAIAKLKSRGIRAEPDIVMSEDHYIPNDPCTLNTVPGCFSPPNPNVPGQWNLGNIHAFEAWDVTQGDGAVIGFIGAGVNPSDPEIGPQLWVNPGETPGDGIDNDANGYVDDVNGIDLYHTPTSNSPFGTFWHDHACAAVAAATTDNNHGIAGVAPHAKIAVVRTASDCGGGASIANFILALDWLQSHGIKTVSVSFGCGPSAGCFSQAVQDAINSYYNSGGIVVASAGNSHMNHSQSSPCYECNMPCDYDKVICVASNDYNDRPSGFSDYGPLIELAAPGGFSSNGGTSIWTSIEYVNYVPPIFRNGTTQGTSFSSPTVAAVAAMIRALHPTWPAGSIRIALQVGGDTVPELAPPVTQWGKRLNALNSVCFALTPKPAACP